MVLLSAHAYVGRGSRRKLLCGPAYHNKAHYAGQEINMGVLFIAEDTDNHSIQEW